jgi:hypothetical protein
MKAYSLDLREKVLTAYHRQEGSIRQLAKRFTVSPRVVGELIVRFAVRVVMPRNPTEVAIPLELMPKGGRSYTSSCSTILMPRLMG